MVLHNTTEWFTTISQTGSTQCLRMVLHNTTEWFYLIPQNGSTQYHITEWFYTIPQNGSSQYQRMVLLNTTEWFYTIPYHRMVLHNTKEWFYSIPLNGSTQYHRMVLLNTGITEWFYSISLNGSTQYHWMVLHNTHWPATDRHIRVCAVQFALFVFANIVMKTTIRLEFTDDSRWFHTKSLHILSCGFAMIARITNTVCKDNINPNSWTNKYTVFQMQQIPTFICK